MAAVGSAVGLGNIWGFPNKMGACGGFTFLLIYLVLAVCCGFIVMVGELALGRKTGHGAVGAYKVLSKKFSCCLLYTSGVPCADDGNIKLSRNKLFHTRPPRQTKIQSYIIMYLSRKCNRYCATC